MTLYFISGLGADERVFQKLVLPQEWNLKYIQWIAATPSETLSSYSKRISAGIDTSDEFVLIGLSFGGIIAVELSKLMKPKLTVLISSISTKNELPRLLSIIAQLKLDVLTPASWYKAPNSFLYWFFGARASEEKRLLRQNIAQTPAPFIKWAIHEIINWKNEARPFPLVHIHGTRDHLFPCYRTRADIKIKGGGHLMVHDRAAEMSRILTEKITGA